MSRYIKRLKDIIAQKEEHANLSSRLEKQAKSIREQENLVEEKKLIFEKEFRDFKAMNRLSFKSVWHKLRGDHAEQMSKEEQEYLAAREILEHVQEELREMRKEFEQFETNVKDLAGAKFQILGALEDAEDELIDADDGKGRRLEQWRDEIENIKAKIEEFHDAYAEGMKVMDCLKQLQRKVNHALDLSSQEQWREDRYNFLEREKYDAIDAAKRYARQTVQIAINQYNRSLGILHQNIDISRILNISHWTREMDMYWDTFGSRWEVHSEIQAAVRKTSDTIRKVDGLQSDIDRFRDDLRKDIEAIIQKRIDLVLE
jgi:archaellum component FlaC